MAHCSRSNKAKTVAIVVHASWQIRSVLRDSSGGLLGVVINKSNAEILIVSAYLPATLDMIGMPTNWSAEDKRPGPSARGEAHAMYATLLDWTKQYPRWLLGGDLNETRNVIDRKHLESKQTKRKGKKTEDMREKQNTEKKNQRGMQKFVNHFLEESRAVDVWRQIYPDTPGHTYRNEQTGSFSRLDYFLISPPLVTSTPYKCPSETGTQEKIIAEYLPNLQFPPG
jgi:exonuclease III